MVIKGNLTRLTGYLPTSPDGVYSRDTGMIHVLTNPDYKKLSINKLKGRESRIRIPEPYTKKEAKTIVKDARNIVKQARK